MHKIEYEIKLNDLGRPCIEFPDARENKPEDKFFAMEIARYILQEVYQRRSAEFDKDAAEKIDITIRLLGQVSDQMAELLWHNMKAYGDTELIFNRTFQIIVDTIEERDSLSFKGILEGERLYMREEGLKVLVRNENKVFELKGGNTNENWVEVI
jgi:hypothetical protein